MDKPYAKTSMFDIEVKATDLELSLRKRIAQLAGNQARVALIGVALGKSLSKALEIAESYPSPPDKR